MRILSITAQKPDSTGSGVFLSELVKVFAEKRYPQAVIAGINRNDKADLPEGTGFFPVRFDTEEVPFPVAGMSDEMPYPSTRYCDMTPPMVSAFEKAFRSRIREAVSSLQPDLILCHHLYLLTAIVREEIQDIPVYGFCHNTDLRQMRKHGLERERIMAAVRRLDRIFVLRKDQIREVAELYGADPAKIIPVGMGYNRNVFFRRKERQEEDHRPPRLIYAGKITQKKGVASLIRSLALLSADSVLPELVCAGGAGNQEEYDAIRKLAEHCPCRITFLGRLDQHTLADLYNESDIFVLPSFYEGIPLTVIEALACGCRVVLSDLAGVHDWLDEFVQDADIRYVKLPAIRNTDEPVEEELPAFENRLAAAIADSISAGPSAQADVSRITWESIAAAASVIE